MTNSVEQLLLNNQEWANRIAKQDPSFFGRLAAQQAPKYLWIGCSDSRVPANEIVGLLPGELFVHRNIANVVVQSDLNCVSVIQFAVDVLKVEHIIVTGHYGCAGVHAALSDKRIGIADHWIGHVRSVLSQHRPLIEQPMGATRRENLVCELNVIEQLLNVAGLPVVRDAWARGQSLHLHAWIYGLKDGLVHDLGLGISHETNIEALRQKGLARLVEIGTPDD